MAQRVIMVDWSAASTVGPLREAADRCWLAWADRGDDGEWSMGRAEYARTRRGCEARVRELIEGGLQRGGSGDARGAQGNAGGAGEVLLGIDAALGYPACAGMPVARGLSRLVASLVEDGEDGVNNRFEVAAQLNARAVTHAAERGRSVAMGPWWGRPRSATKTVPMTRPVPYEWDEWREVEASMRSRGLKPQSAFKLAGAASVGSQSLLALAMIERVATSVEAVGARVGVWPWEEPAMGPAGRVTIAEIWPSLFDEDAEAHAIRDARQVLAAARWAASDRARLADALREGRDACRDGRGREGWILGWRRA
jgi:hypothetical protein